MALLFRQAALERLSTPERIERALHVTTAQGWIALVALLVMAAAIGVRPAFGEHVISHRGGLKGHEVARLPAELDADEVDRPARGAVLVRVAPLA